MALNSVALAPRQLSLVKRCLPPLLPHQKPFSVGRCFAMAAPATKQVDDGNLKVERKEGSSSPARLAPSIAPSSRLLTDMMMMNPFNAATSLLQMMNAMDGLLNSTFPSAFGERNVRMPWDVMENENELKLRMDMPGLTKEDIKVRVEDGTLLIEGEMSTSDADKEEKWARKSYGRYQSRILLPENVKTDEIKAEMKNGVLLLTLPKQEAKKEIHDIQVN